jgi:hypothetical protein
LHVPRQNISAHVPMRLDVSSIGPAHRVRHRIRDEFTKRPQLQFPRPKQSGKRTRKLLVLDDNRSRMLAKRRRQLRPTRDPHRHRWQGLRRIGVDVVAFQQHADVLVERTWACRRQTCKNANRSRSTLNNELIFSPWACPRSARCSGRKAALAAAKARGKKARRSAAGCSPASVHRSP